MRVREIPVGSMSNERLWRVLRQAIAALDPESRGVLDRAARDLAWAQVRACSAELYMRGVQLRLLP